MANEWVKVELYGHENDGQPRRYTIADGTSVSKGTLLALTDPRTVVAATATMSACAGVAAEDHDANTGVTSISVWTDGIFEAVASGGIVVGEPIVNADNNKVKTYGPGVASGAYILGYSLETAIVDVTETINVRLHN